MDIEKLIEKDNSYLDEINRRRVEEGYEAWKQRRKSHGKYRGFEVFTNTKEVVTGPDEFESYTCGYATFPRKILPNGDWFHAIEVHGGTTFDQDWEDGNFTIGFDTGHLNDPTWTEQETLEEVKRMVDSAITVIYSTR